MKAAPIVQRRAVQLVEAARPAVALTRLVARGPVERPKVVLAGELVRLGDQLLDQGEAVRLWAELGEALGLAERERRPRAWAHLVTWLDVAFLGAPTVEVREGKARISGPAYRYADGRRALVRLGPFTVAHLRLRRKAAKTFTGMAANYFPGSMGLNPRNPDALLAFTNRRIKCHRRILDATPLLETR